MKSKGLTILLMILSAIVIYTAGATPFIALVESREVGADMISLYTVFWYGCCIAVPRLIWKRHKRVMPRKAEPVQASHIDGIDMNDSSY